MSQSEKYSLTLRILHWVLAFGVIGMLIIGVVMTYGLTPPLKFVIYGNHKAIGMTVGVLMVFRLLVRLFSEVPKAQFAQWEAFAMRAVHFSLYFAIIGAVFSGYLMSCGSGRLISWFGLFDFPVLFSRNLELAKAAHSAHQVLVYSLTCLIGLHILAAFKHLLVDGKNIFKRMF